jgi:hypothetical protein
MSRIRFLQWTLLVVFTSASGCGGGDEGPVTYPVSGTITRKGSAVAEAVVSFIPDAGGPSAVGVTDASGRYQLTTRVKDDGAAAGKYKVTVAKYEGQQPPVTGPVKMHADYDISNEYPAGYDESKASQASSKNVLPAKYANADLSGLKADVVEGENKLDFDIKD